MAGPAKRVLLALGLFVALAASFTTWAVSSPVGSSPDDPFHLASIWCASDQPGRECAETGGSADKGSRNRLLPENVVGAPCYAMDNTKTAACQRALDSRLVPSPVNSGLYPQGFYRVMRVFAHGDVASAVLAMRLTNALLAAAMITAALMLAGTGLRRASALSWLVGLVPLGVFFIPSTNPTSWTVVGLGTYWVFMVRFLRGGRSWATWVAGGLAVVSALLAITSRVDGSAYLCVATAVAALLVLRRPRELLTPRMALPVILGATAFVRFFTFSTSSVLVSGASPHDASEPGRHGFGLLLNNVFNFPTFLAGMFGQSFGLGWLDTYMPPAVGATTCALAVFLVLLSVGTYWPWKRASVTLLGFSIVAVPLLVLQQSHAFVGEVVQPRYVYPLVLVFYGAVAYTADARTEAGFVLRRAHLIALVVGASVANSVALHTEIKRYVMGLAVRRLDLDAGVAWWWSAGPSPMALWVIGSLAAAAMFCLFGMLSLPARTVPVSTAAVPVAEPERVLA